MLIAVASKDGHLINQHFGHAERFLIFDVDGGKARLVDERAVERYCSFDPDHPLRRHLLESIAGALKDCRAIVSAQMGEAPREALENLGLQAYVISGPIKSTLIELAKIL